MKHILETLNEAKATPIETVKDLEKFLNRKSDDLYVFICSDFDPEMEEIFDTGVRVTDNCIEFCFCPSGDEDDNQIANPTVGDLKAFLKKKAKPNFLVKAHNGQDFDGVGTADIIDAKKGLDIEGEPCILLLAPDMGE